MITTKKKEKISTAEIWSVYQANHDVELRNELIMRYSGLVRSISRRMANISRNYAEEEDLESYGMLGLIKAIEKYDSNRGAGFETFAIYRIRGEILDYIRRNDWIPRSVRKRSQEFENTVDRITSELGRKPTEQEISKALGVPCEKMNQVYSTIEKYTVVSLEELLQKSSSAPDEYGGGAQSPEGTVQEKELTEVLTGAVEKMAERERLIITLYYYEEFSLKEISEILGVSESRVSQLHSRAIREIRKILQAYLNNQ